jgi:aspartyl-tRNA(Asn)/glutamyl-tRNA(Gln) amidotransferase subunit A
VTTGDLPFLTLTEAAAAIARREVSPTDLVELMLTRIARFDPALDSYISVQTDAAYSAAKRAEKALQKQGATLGPLHGVPMSIKDLMLTRDAPTTAGSRVFGKGLDSPHDATVVRRIRAAGAIIIGKTNLNEFALGVTTENAHFGQTHNPWNPEVVPGGSSGGSAVAVAAGLCYASVGTDTRGSIRIPASACGITGLKPTYGLVPTEGVLPLSWTLDHVGPMTHTVEDAALLLSMMIGKRKMLSAYEKALNEPVRRLRIGVAGYFWSDLHDGVRDACERALSLLEGDVLELRELDMRTLEAANAASDVICLAEAAVYHEPHLAQNPDGFGPKVKKRLEGFSAYSAVELVKAQRTRLQCIEEFNGAFEQVDCIIAPALPTLPPLIDQKMMVSGTREDTVLKTMVRLNAPQNMAGVPALVLPCGFVEELPVGLQIISAPGNENVLFRLGAHYQRATDWHTHRPPNLQSNPPLSGVV